jgi:phytoene synthase
MTVQEPAATADQRTTPPLTPEVLRSFEHCHRVARQRARNFYYGLKLTPEPKRSAVYVIYAFMRACDDLADDQPATTERDPEQVRDQLRAFRQTMQSVLDRGAHEDLPPGEIWPAFRYVMHAYDIDAGLMHQMLDGQEMDLTRTRYRSFDELYDYCYKVASVVGLVCIEIWGYDGGAATRKLAEYRGIALQLTNILRDIAEDAQRNRIYLPRDELERFGVAEPDLLARQPGPAFDRLMRFQIERAQSYYSMAATLEKHVDAASRPTCWAMMRIYRGLLDRIAADPRRVLQRRIALSPVQKIRIAASACWRKPWPV